MPVRRTRSGAMKYPDDDNGDALRRMEALGDDLSHPHSLEFTVVFSDEASANGFANHFSALGYAASVEFAETVPDFPWDVIVVRNMIPSHEEIGTFEELLQRVADLLGGHNDGWGCFSEPSSIPSVE